MFTSIIFSALLAQSAQGAMPVTSAPTYAVTQRFTIGGLGGWDCLGVDAASHRLYIARADRVLVVDTESGKLIATIPSMDGAHGIALVPRTEIGFVSNGHAGSVTQFNLATAKPVREIPIKGENPDALVYDRATHHLFVFNGRSHDASVIDPSSGKTIATIVLPGAPEFAVSNEHGALFVNIEDTAQLVRIDAAKATVSAIWKLADCEEPSGIALDGKHHRVFSVCHNERMAVTDARTGRHVASVPIGKGPDGAAFDLERGLIFSPNGADGTLTVVHEDDPDHYHVVANVTTQASARTLALDPKTHRVYTVAAEFAPAPAPTAAEPHPRRSVVDGTFTVLVVGEQ
jgi:DNA-binding beta-propeller fold protein YncE